MRGNNNEYRKGGPHDDVANNIRAQQQADAMPSQEEMEAEMQQAEVVHAEYVAARAVLEHNDAHVNKASLGAVAQHFGWDALARKMKGRYGDLSDFQQTHMEAHEKPEIPDDYRGQLPPSAHVPPFPVNERVRRLKADRYKQVFEQGIPEVATDGRGIAPMGMARARAVVVDGVVYTNETWSDVMGDDRWNSRTAEDTREKNREALREKAAKLGFDADAHRE